LNTPAGFGSQESQEDVSLELLNLLADELPYSFLKDGPVQVIGNLLADFLVERHGSTPSSRGIEIKIETAAFSPR
jgi:hypothetical protein